MNKTVLTSFTILCLLPIVFLMGLSFNIQPVKASGTIIIRADGSVEGTTNIVTADNVTYTLNATINDSIVVKRSNIIIDGAGHTVNGLGLGFNLINVNNVTIKNTQIKQFSRGINLSNSSGNTVSGNNITNNDDGVYLYDSSSYNTISGNNITNNNDYGVSVRFLSNHNTVSGNNIINNNYGVWVRYSSGYNTVSGNNITNNNDYGVSVKLSFNNTVSGNNIINNEHGIELSQSSSYNSVSRNNITNNKYGIRLESPVPSESSFNNTVSGNNITNNTVGVYLRRSFNNTVSGNNIINNEHGIELSESSNYNSISGNNIINNNDGVYIWGSGNMVSGNNITNNTVGVDLRGSSSYNTVSGNNITNNNDYGVSVKLSYDNRFFHNNFINNTDQVYSEFSVNIWDDGYPSGGNYWSDYVDKYPDSSELDGSGLWDTPYVIDIDNQDNYPIIPEFTSTVLLPIFIMLSTTAIALAKQKNHKKSKR